MRSSTGKFYEEDDIHDEEEGEDDDDDDSDLNSPLKLRQIYKKKNLGAKHHSFDREDIANAIAIFVLFSLKKKLNFPY